MDFKKLKVQSGEAALRRMRQHIRFPINKHKSTKLKVLGSRAGSTLLDKGVAKAHSARLEKQFVNRWGELKKNDALERLRFWTVLHAVVPLDEDEIASSIEHMRSCLKLVCEGVKGIEVIGVVEIEIVNIPKMKQLATNDEEARKLNVIGEMLPANKKGSLPTGFTSHALVHFHGVLDLGMDSSEKHDAIAQRAKQFWEKSYQVELKRFHSDKPVSKSLANIAQYLVKGGNESLIYKINFGWDSVQEMERAMMKKGKDKLGADFEGFENELSLSIEEVKVLGSVLDKLMGSTGSKNLRNGYLFKYGQQVKWIG